MTLSNKELKNIMKFWESTEKSHECPTCHKKIRLNINSDMMQKIAERNKGIYPHLNLHGNPLHGMVCYIDTQMCIRSISAIESIEISKDPETFQQLMNN